MDTNVTPGTIEAPSRRGRRAATARSIGPQTDWYKDAIIYQLHVKAFRTPTTTASAISPA